MLHRPVQYDLFALVAMFTDEKHPLFGVEDVARFAAVFPGVDTLVADWAADFPVGTKRADVLMAGLVMGYMVREALIKNLDKGVGFSTVELHDLLGRMNKRPHLNRG